MDIFEEYKDKSQDELMSELLKNVQKQKDDGTFNYQSLSSSVEKLSPFLNAEQKNIIKELLQKIR